MSDNSDMLEKARVPRTSVPAWALRMQNRESEVKLLRSDTELPAADAVVVVMGPTGAGKSRFIREATGEDVEVGDSLQSSEQKQVNLSASQNSH
jgi:ABC-type hemin transport system ATPase subunit